VKRSHQENTVGPWARQKLDGLEAYLNGYTTALKKQSFKTVYIDAFAGAGKSRIRDAWSGSDDEDISLFDDDFFQSRAEFIEGSPVRALSLTNNFSEHYFFDLDPQRAEVLERLNVEFPAQKISVQVGDANQMIQSQISRISQGSTRGVAFLDPYGPHLDWATVACLAETKKFEVLINFPLGMAINRLITRSGIIPDKWREDLNCCFGTTEWESRSYREQFDLFGDKQKQKADNAGAALLELYCQNLEKIFSHVSRPSVVRNTRGVPIYYMIWAGPHPLGYKIAEHVLALGEKVQPLR
jgi:three-Cys-motif partner protein